MEERKKILAGAFLDVKYEVAGRQLRPFSVGSLNMLFLTQNAIFSKTDDDEEAGGAEGDGEELDHETIQSLCEYVLIHTMPVPEVSELALNNRQAFRAKAMELGFELSMSDFKELFEVVGAQQAEAEAAMVDPEPEGDGEPGKTRRSPSGSPPSYLISEQLGTMKKNYISSGGAVSQESSSTSTQLIEKAEPSAASQ